MTIPRRPVVNPIQWLAAHQHAKGLSYDELAELTLCSPKAVARAITNAQLRLSYPKNDLVWVQARTLRSVKAVPAYKMEDVPSYKHGGSLSLETLGLCLWVYIFRHKRGITQAALGDLMGCLGSHISRMEQNVIYHRSVAFSHKALERDLEAMQRLDSDPPDTVCAAPPPEVDDAEEDDLPDEMRVEPTLLKPTLDQVLHNLEIVNIRLDDIDGELGELNAKLDSLHTKLDGWDAAAPEQKDAKLVQQEEALYELSMRGTEDLRVIAIERGLHPEIAKDSVRGALEAYCIGAMITES